VPNDARFCPYCGKPYIEETVTCPQCGEENGLDEPNCRKCGFTIFVEKKEPLKPPPANNIFEDSSSADLEQDLANRFSLAFRRRMEEEHVPAQHQAYFDRFLNSDFKKSVDYRIQQLAEEFQRVRLQGNDPFKELKNSLETGLDELLDYFIVRHCADLNETVFPEKMLKYQGLPLEKINLGEMVTDYLDFDSEEETVYFDFITMPANKLKNAAEAFLFPKKGETIYFICDGSMLGNCKEGFAMTKEAIYWKATWEKPQRVYYNKIREVKRQEDWITINGIFFNANKGLNIKLIRLLKKLGRLTMKYEL
jgi:ribosomal protein L40E